MPTRAYKYRFSPTQEHLSWLKDVSSVPLQQSLRHLDTAYTNFFEGRAEYPVFKKKHGDQAASYTDNAFTWDGEPLTLAKIADQRRDFQHKRSTKLIRENQVVCIQTLAVKNMLQNHSLAKSISDVGWGEFTRQLEYKAKWYGRTLIKIDRWYSSSKTCSACQHVLETLSLDIREWMCPSRGVCHDRDINAASNILAAGLAVSACGETVRPNLNGTRQGTSRRSRNPAA